MTRRPALALSASLRERNPHLRPACAFCRRLATYVVGPWYACDEHRSHALAARRRCPPPAAPATPAEVSPLLPPQDAVAVHHRRSTPHAGAVVVVDVPGLRLVSEANTRAAAHWARSHRTAAARSAVALALRGRTLPPLPLRVCITRRAPGTLDDDNAASACKATRDGIAAALGIDDADPRVVWRVAQERTKRGVYGVRVTLVPLPARRSTVDVGETADVVRLRVPRGDVQTFVMALLREGCGTLRAGGVVVETTVEADE